MKRSRKTLRILTYNIHKGFNLGNRSYVLSAMKKLIHEIDADMVLLQEIRGEERLHVDETSSWPSSTQFEYLADKIWKHFAYGKNAISHGGHHGNAILSKFPIRHWNNIDISTNSLERRGLLHAEIECDFLSHPLHCLCLHLNLLARSRVRQLQAVVSRISDQVPHAHPFVLGGDFNDWSQQASDIISTKTGAVEVFKELHGEYAKSFPAPLPVLTLDRIYVRHLLPRSAVALHRGKWKKLSDHAPLLCEVSAI